MPTSSYMPNVVVEIAFGSGYATPAASRSWTDVSAYVELGEGITISGGRQNERSTADANQCSLTLDNSDGRFTAGLASSPYYPNVKLDVPIRVRVAPRTNLILNPSLETVTTNWSVFSATLGRSNSVSPAVSGTWYGTLTMVGGGGVMSVYGPATGTAGCPVTPSRSYRAMVSMRAATIARTCQMEVFWYKSDGSSSAIAANTVVTSAADAVGSWTLLSGLVTPPADAAFAALLVYVNSAPNAEVHHFDAAFFGEDGPYFDGTTATTDFGMTHAWTGAAHGSTSTEGIADATRFLGFINEWPVEWNGTGAYASASVTASSRISRLGYTAGLKSLVEIAILADAPLAYYTLGEPSGATQANDSSGANAPPLLLTGDPALPVVFGNATGPGTDSLTAATFATGQYLAGGPQVTAGAALSAECFILCETAPAVEEAFLDVAGVSLSVNTSGVVVGYRNNATVVDTGVSVADGLTHHITVTVSAGGSWVLYLDGASVDTAAAGATTVSSQLSVGGYPPLDPSGVGATMSGLTGVLAHVAVYSTVLAAGDVLDHATAGSTGYAGETVDDRLERYASYANILPAEISAEASTILVQHVDTTDKQVVDLMRVMETTEGGVLYDARDGTLTFHNRAHRYSAASAFTLDMNEQEVEAGYQPLLDRTDILNDVTVKNVSGTYSARKTDPTSLSSYGPMTATIETADIDDDAPLNMASWLVATYKDPRVRVASCGVNVLAQVGKSPNSATVLAATVGTKITVSNHPAQAASSSATYFVEGWSEAYGPESLQVTWNLSPTSPWDQTLIIGDGSRGFIGANPIAF